MRRSSAAANVAMMREASCARAGRAGVGGSRQFHAVQGLQLVVGGVAQAAMPSEASWLWLQGTRHGTVADHKQEQHGGGEKVAALVAEGSPEVLGVAGTVDVVLR